MRELKSSLIVNGTYFSLLKIEARAQVLELSVGRLAKD